MKLHEVSKLPLSEIFTKNTPIVVFFAFFVYFVLETLGWFCIYAGFQKLPASDSMQWLQLFFILMLVKRICSFGLVGDSSSKKAI